MKFQLGSSGIVYQIRTDFRWGYDHYESGYFYIMYIICTIYSCAAFLYLPKNVHLMFHLRKGLQTVLDGPVFVNC